MKNKPLKDESFKKKKDGSFSIEIDKNAKEEDSSFADFHKLDMPHGSTRAKITIESDIHDEEEPVEITSLLEPAQTLLLVIKALVGMVFIIAEVYHFSPEDAMQKVRKSMDALFYKKLNGK